MKSYIELMPTDEDSREGWPWEVSINSPPEKMPDGSDWPRISIVTPSYNQGEFIEETIRSVLMQGYPNLEYIIIDGGSTDNSVEIIKKYEPWLTYWVSEPDSGQTQAINKGFSKATGDIYAYINSDDYYLPGTLLRVASDFSNMGRPRNYWALYCVEDFGACNAFVHFPEKSVNLCDWVLSKANIHQPGVFWTANLYQNIGGFDERYQYAFDRKFFMEIVNKGVIPVRFDSVVATRFRYHPESKTSIEHNIDSGENKFLDEFFQIHQEFEKYLEKHERKIPFNRRRQRALSLARIDLHLQEATSYEKVKSIYLLLKKYPSAVFTRFFWGSVRRILS